jgi:hypothetical protein
MHPLPRALLLSLVWLVVALLPLRGWAQAQMGLAQNGLVQMGGAAMVATASPAAGGHGGSAEMTTAHCEAMFANAGFDQADEAAAGGQPDPHHPADHTSHAGCTLCVVCHAGLAASPEVRLMLPAPLPASPLPSAAPRGIPDGAPSPLFRPPRRST